MLYCRYLAGCHIGVGLTWYTWLEQGRDIGVSSTFLDNLARVLKLVGEQEDFSNSEITASFPIVKAIKRYMIYGGRYFCTNCLFVHDSIGTCEHCSGSSTFICEMSGLWVL